MLYVLDASVAIKFLIPEPLSDVAEVAIAAFRSGAIRLIAPDIISAEVGHGLRRHVLNGELSTDAWFDAIADYLYIGVPTVPSLGLVSRATRFSADHLGSFYDALYVSLAAERDCRVLTADEPMTRAFAKLDRTVWLGDFKAP